MAQSKFTIYKYVKLKNGSWRYCRTAFYSNGKIKPNRCIAGGKEEDYPEGAYYLYHKKNWTLVGADALEAQRQRNARLDAEEFQRLRGTAPAPSSTMQATFDRLTLSAAAEKYFSNCEKRGELHSSKLEYLGIVTAMRGFCKELSERQKVKIEFTHDDISSRMPQEISICLFRVLQEALQNAVKHSGARRFDVELRYSSDAIDLTVRDLGSGFDVQQARSSRGLGLIRMEERLKPVDGQFSIDSQPQLGTRIRARVPLGKAARASA